LLRGFTVEKAVVTDGFSKDIWEYSNKKVRDFFWGYASALGGAVGITYIYLL
jgi:hypothetical protein